MSRARTMLLNTALLTAASLLMRGVGMVFQVWLSNRIGAAGIGLFQLIMSVSMLASTFAISGIRFAATRLVSMELGSDNSGGVSAAVRRCLAYAMLFGFSASAFLYLGAPVIGGTWIGDARTVLSLRILSASLPAYALAAVLGGYFTAVCRVVKSAVVAVAEQTIRIAAIVISLNLSAGHDIEVACAIVVAGGVVGEVSSFLMLFGLYLYERRGLRSSRAAARGMTRRMLGISLPLALSAYARSALSTLQHLLVPRGLKKSGSTAERALADYGIMHGMALPVIMFPSAIFYSFAELIVPELTDAQMRGDERRISRLVSKTLRLGLLFSIGLMACMWGFGSELGEAVYNNPEVGGYIKTLALIMPIMFLDSMTDGMLRGLGQQMSVMVYNILDSAISVALVYILLPKYAVAGYVFMIAFTEIVNFGLSVNRLRKITKIRFSIPVTLKSLFAAFGAINLSVFFTRILGSPEPRVPLLVLRMLLCLLLYGAALLLFGCFEKNELQSVVKFILGLEKRIKAWYAVHVNKTTGKRRALRVSKKGMHTND